MKAIIYNRKSRGGIEELHKNRIDMIEYCKRKEFEYVYLEEIASSVDDERESYRELINYVETGEFNVIVTLDLSRLTRSLKHQLELFEILSANNVIIHTILDNEIIDTTNQMSEMMSIFKGTFNQMAYRETARKMNFGRLQSVKQGRYVGIAPFGYSKNEEMKLEVIEEEAYVIRRIFNLILQGFSITQIYQKIYNEGFRSRTGHVFHVESIGKFLRNRVYIGEINFNSKKLKEKIRVKDAHEAIISHENFYKAREVIDSRRQFSQRISKTLSPVDKLIFCKHCGWRTIISRGSGKNNNYFNLNKCKNFKDGVQCTNRGISIRLFLPTIYEQIELQIPKIEEKLKDLYEFGSEDKIDGLQTERELIRKKKSEKEKMKKKLLDYLLNETISESDYLEKNKEVESEIEALEERVEEIEVLLVDTSIDNDTERIEKMINNLKHIKEKSVEEQNRIIKQLISKINYSRDADDNVEIEIEYKD